MWVKQRVVIFPLFTRLTLPRLTLTLIPNTSCAVRHGTARRHLNNTMTESTTRRWTCGASGSSPTSSWAGTLPSMTTTRQVYNSTRSLKSLLVDLASLLKPGFVRGDYAITRRGDLMSVPLSQSSLRFAHEVCRVVFGVTVPRDWYRFLEPDSTEWLRFRIVTGQHKVCVCVCVCV